MRNRFFPWRNTARTLACSAGLAAMTLCVQSAQAQGTGTWTRLVRNPPQAVNLMLLLTDGTVMCSNCDGSTITNRWYKLTPDATGSYSNGTWTTLATMHDTRLYFQTIVLRDGRVFCSGGEYGTGGPKAEIYDPQTNIWTSLTIPSALWNPSTDDFYDCNAEILPDGSVLLMPVFPHTSGRAIKYNPATNVWSSGGTLFRGHYQDEATWIKLPDDTILTLDPFGSNTYGNSPSERFNPPTNSWINDSVCPVNLYDPFGFELGGASLLPSGRVIFIGSLPVTAIYTPTGTTAPGTWIAGPALPGSRGCPDGPCAPLVNGRVLCALSPTPTGANHFPSPTTFWEYDEPTNSFISAPAPVGASDNSATYKECMLCLPNGQVMYSHMGTAVYVYTPGGTPLPMGKPVIQSVTPNGDGSYHVTGTGLNGITEGASYGDDWQMFSNYPLVRFESGANVYYGRTYNFSSTSVRTGNRVLSADFRPPANLPPGQYNLVVVGNQYPSDPMPFCTTPLSISQGPAPAAACVGGQASFGVSAGGSGTITYQWFRGVTALANGGHISGAQSPTLVLNPVTLGDTGDYSCYVSHGCGSLLSNAAHLTVNSCCPVDFNDDGFLDFFDLDAYMQCFEGVTCPPGKNADFNGDGFVDFFDSDAFVEAFDAGC